MEPSPWDLSAVLSFRKTPGFDNIVLANVASESHSILLAFSVAVVNFALVKSLFVSSDIAVVLFMFIMTAVAVSDIKLKLSKLIMLHRMLFLLLLCGCVQFPPADTAVAEICLANIFS